MKMPHISKFWLVALLGCVGEAISTAGTVFDRYSAYHHIQVIDQGGTRTLSFNGSLETRMSLADPLKGHFEYTEYFRLPWLWNPDVERVLMVGLGGGSTQRAWLHYQPEVQVETVELDSMVIDVARDYFRVAASPRHKIRQEDGRTFLRRTSERYDVILMDAYSTSRYGSSLPAHLTTREFFTLARDRMTTNGVLAYNVIGQLQGWQANIVGALHRTLNEVFPQVYAFPATESRNVVLIATRSPRRYTRSQALQQATALVSQGKVRFPNFTTRLRNLAEAPPQSIAASPILTDDRAPLEGLLDNRKKQFWP